MTKPKAQKQTAGWFDSIFSRPYQTIFITCILLYGQILTFGLVHFDDHGFVLMAADTLKLSNIPDFFSHSVFWVLGDTTQETDVFYRPLQNVAYAICNTFAPRQAWFYHFVGLLLHGLTSCVLFRFFKELKYSPPVALVFTLVYSVHPILVQGVAWIAGIGDQLAALLSLLSVIYFFRFASDLKKMRLNDFLIHAVCFLGALFSKEVSVMLIPLLLFWYLVVNRGSIRKNYLLISLITWIFIAGFYFILRNAAVYSGSGNLLLSAFESFKVNGPLLFEYFEKIFIPYRLSPIPSRQDAQLLIGALVFVTFVSIIVYKKRFTATSLFGAVWFIVFLFPTFIQQNPQAHFFAFEHRLYLPLIGIVIIVMELLDIKQLNFNSGTQKFGFPLLLLLLAVAAFSHSRTFKDPYTFYDKALSSSPGSVIAYNGYGKLLLEDKKYAEAVEAFKKSHEHKPDDLQTTGKIAEIYLKNLNDPSQAVVWFKKTLDIAPNSIEAAVSIGDAYFNFLHDTSNAIIGYEKALQIDPGNEFASASLGVIFAGKGKYAMARTYFTQSLHSNPKNLVSLKWMAISYFNEGKVQEAVNYLNKAYQYYPNDADLHRNLMICYYKLNDKKMTGKFASLLSGSGNEIPAEVASYLNSK